MNLAHMKMYVHVRMYHTTKPSAAHYKMHKPYIQEMYYSPTTFHAVFFSQTVKFCLSPNFT